VTATTVVAGSLDALHRVVRDGTIVSLKRGTDIVLVPTAAAFTGIAEAAIELSSVFDDLDVNVEALMISDRTSCSEPYFAERMRNADVVVIGDGSALHAKTVWRDTPVGEAIRDAEILLAVGSTASVLGDVMIDPRGGAPMVGLGYRHGVAMGVSASDDQLSRTRSLVGGDTILAILGATGVLYFDGEWKSAGDVTLTLGEFAVEF
jgi:cyanophycinase-like exopeptidase